METLGEGLKKIILAGIGTAATTAEKSKEILDDMVKKGELTVEQGKVLNQELKHNLKKTVRDTVGGKTQPVTSEEMDEMLEGMTAEQIEQLKAKLANIKDEDVVEIVEEEETETETEEDTEA